MRAELFSIAHTTPGRLNTMARPRGGGWLPGEMGDLASAGVDILVSLLTDAEQAELALSGEAEAAAAAGLRFHRLPTPDLHVPDGGRLLALAADLLARLRDGENVVIHCWMGIGRSSTLAATILVLDNVPPEQAWARISAARGLPVPETAAQRDFVAGLAPAPRPDRTRPSLG